MKYIILILISVIAISCNEESRKLPYYNSPDFTPRWEKPAGNAFHQIRPFTLIDQANEIFTEKDIDGKICVADFFFTACPGICPKLAASMSGLQQQFEKDDDVLLLSHTVTPETDSVPVLKKYAAAHEIKLNRWRLLTGNRNEIYDLGRKFYFVEEDLGVNNDSTIFLHTENFVLIDKNRFIRGIYNGLDPQSMQSLTADIKVLQKEK